jgi:hypothetical protein
MAGGEIGYDPGPRKWRGLSWEGTWHSPMGPAAALTPGFAEHGATQTQFTVVDERYTVAVGLAFDDVVAICEGAPFEARRGISSPSRALRGGKALRSPSSR